MATSSLNGGYVVSDKATGKRFAEGYRESVGRREKLPDTFELLENGRRYLETRPFGE